MNYDVFSALLRRAIGSKKKQQFAELIGCSPAYISRLLGGSLGTKPSFKLLQKIADVSEDESVDLETLLNVCGLLQEKAEDPEKILEDMSKTMKDLANTINQNPGELYLDWRGCSAEEQLKKRFGNKSYDVRFQLEYGEIKELKKNVDEEAKRGLVGQSYIGVCVYGTVPPVTEEEGEKYNCCAVCMILEGIRDYGGKLYLLKATQNMNLIRKVFLFPDADLIGKMMEKQSPSVLYYNPLISLVKDSRADDSRMVPRYDVIITQGYGFHLDEITIKVLEYALNHADSWNADSKKAGKLREWIGSGYLPSDEEFSYEMEVEWQKIIEKSALNGRFSMKYHENLKILRQLLHHVDEEEIGGMFVFDLSVLDREGSSMIQFMVNWVNRVAVELGVEQFGHQWIYNITEVENQIYRYPLIPECVKAKADGKYF